MSHARAMLVEKALRLISEGEMGRAVHLLDSNGLADLGDEAEQFHDMARKIRMQAEKQSKWLPF